MKIMTTTNREALGPAERIINTVLTFCDHLFHNRPGYVTPDSTSATGVRWYPCTWVLTEGQGKVVFRLDKAGTKTRKVRVGVLQESGRILDGTRDIGYYMSPGIFREVAVWGYRQIAEVWKVDNEFAARWASHVFSEDRRDLKVLLAAFMLCQSRKGEPVLDQGKVAFLDEDYRDIGEAMLLIKKKGGDFDPKQVLRVRDLLMLPEIAQINRELGFGNSARKPFLGRWETAARKYLRYRESNPALFKGLLDHGHKSSVIELSKRCGYKPASPKFFQALRWKQEQAAQGHRNIAIGQSVAAAETWESLTETQICEKIMQERPGYKKIVSLVPRDLGVTRAIMAAAIEAGSLS